MKRRRAASPEDDTIADFEVLGKQLENEEFFGEYNDLIYGYNISRNALLVWQALLHCKRHGRRPPDNLIDLLGQYGERLVAAAQKPGAGGDTFSKALDLKAGAKGLTAWQRADNWRHKVRALTLMNTLVRNKHFAWPVPKAARAVANQVGLSAATLTKDYSRWMQKSPRSASDWRSPNYYAFTAHLAALPKKRKAR